MSRDAAWRARRAHVVPRGVGTFDGGVTVASAQGARVTDADGHELIDFAGGIGVMNVGHGDPDVVAAIRAQAGTLLHACFHVATYEPYLALCERLAGLLPHGDHTKVVLVNTGAEAVENAIKIARQATGRPAVLCFEGAFHGRTMLAMSLTSKSSYKHRCGPFAPEIYRHPYPSYFHNGAAGETAGQYVERELTRLRESFKRGPIAADQIAAVIIEVVQGEGGFIPAPAAYLRGLQALCDEHGILLIFDEVQSGFGRTGAWAAYQHHGLTPDLSTWAKSLGGGLPIAAVIGRAAVMDQAAPGTLGGTFGGNPVACAAALATLDVLERNDLNRRAQAIGATVRARFDALAARCDLVADVRGLGAMIALELCHARDPRRPATEATAAVVARCRAEGVLVITAGAYNNIIRILAPLVIDDVELGHGLTIIERAVLDAAAQKAS
ncbi:MAG: aspartate aminotransferase family protein [Kofleriaceae bacterium]